MENLGVIGTIRASKHPITPNVQSDKSGRAGAELSGVRNTKRLAGGAKRQCKVTVTVAVKRTG